MSDIPKLEVATHESYKDGSKHIGRIVDCAECMDGNELENYQLVVGAYLEGIDRANEMWKSAQKSETCSEE